MFLPLVYDSRSGEQGKFERGFLNFFPKPQILRFYKMCYVIFTELKANLPMGKRAKSPIFAKIKNKINKNIPFQQKVDLKPKTRGGRGLSS